MSEAPPPFTMPAGPAPARGGNRTLWIVLGILALLLCGCCGVVSYFLYRGVRDVMPVVGCAVSYEQVRTAILDYAAENDETLPNAQTWQDDVRPFLVQVQQRSREDSGPIPVLNPNQPFGCQFGNVTTGMSFNSELSGAKLQEIKEPYETVLIFEVEQPAANLSGEYTARPKSSGPPFMFGERRDWFFVTIKGKGNLDEFGEENSRGGALKIIERESQ